MTQIVCKDTHKRRDYKIKLHLFTFIQLINGRKQMKEQEKESDKPEIKTMKTYMYLLIELAEIFVHRH